MFLIYLAVTLSIEFGINTGGVYPIELIEMFLWQGEFTSLFEHSTSGVNNLYDGMYLWAASDKRMDALSDLTCNGEQLKIYLEASYTPRWMSGWYSSGSVETLNNSPIRDEWYADLVSVIVSRYRTNGIFGLSNGITGIGLWNEPDGCGALLPSKVPDDISAMIRYGEVAAIAAEAIRATDPTIEIVSGGFLSPSAKWPTPQYGWEADVYYRMQPIFSGLITEYPPPHPMPSEVIAWTVMPSALHWHPYREHSDYSINPSWEEWFDPLVIDADDLMFRNRPEELPVFLNSILHSNSFPLFDWTQITQYAMEYCPIYALPEWESIPDWQDFYTEWRANYFITTNLMLLESGDMDLLAPYPASADKWWVPVETGGWHNMEYPEEGLEPFADPAYIHMSNQLSGKNCLSVSEDIMVPGGQVSVWAYSGESSFLIDMLALRTCRDSATNELFDYDEIHTIQMRIPLGVTAATHTTIRGDVINDVVLNRETISVGISGFVSYLELLYGDQEQSILVESEIVKWTVSSNCITVSVSSNSAIDVLSIFDLSGRIIRVLVGTNTGRFREFSWNWGETSVPNGVYFASLSQAGEIVNTRKVVVF